MALELLVAAMSAGWPRSRSLTLAWIVGAVATLTAVEGSAVRTAPDSSTVHTDPSAWASYASRINIAAGVGVLIAAICGWRPRPRPGNPAPRS
jgi:hypothetical protein